MTTLFDPVLIGEIAAANRIVMAPLTRDRAGPGGVPTALMAEYYAQRASAGLIVSEGTQISVEGQGYLDTPGIYTSEQIAGWRRVTDAVHAAGGKIVVQLWHVGRISHVSLYPPGMVPVSSSAIQADAQTFTANGFEKVSAPRELRIEEIARIVSDFRTAAGNAIEAGFDGIEVHGANGYLVEQFLRDSMNKRTDEYGGSLENRARFGIEVMTAIAEEIGANRAGIRISPVTPVNDAALDSNTQALYDYFMDHMAALQLAFIHVVEGHTGGPRDNVPFDYIQLHDHFKRGNEAGTWIANNDYTREMALEAVTSERVDAVAFGKPFISNPDLVHRLREDAPFAPVIKETMYGGDATGYTDYPALELVKS